MRNIVVFHEYHLQLFFAYVSPGFSSFQTENLLFNEKKIILSTQTIFVLFILQHDHSSIQITTVTLLETHFKKYG